PPRKSSQSSIGGCVSPLRGRSRGGAWLLHDFHRRCRGMSGRSAGGARYLVHNPPQGLTALAPPGGGLTILISLWFSSRRGFGFVKKSIRTILANYCL